MAMILHCQNKTNRAGCENVHTVIESPRLRPFVRLLAPERDLFIFVEFAEALEARRMLADEGTLLEQSSFVGEVVLGGKGLNVSEELRLGDAGERILYAS